MRAKTIKADTTGDLETELAEITSTGFRPALALVFSSVRQNHHDISRLFSSKGLAVFGATTAGEFIDGEVGEGSVVAMLLDIDPGYFQILFVPIEEEKLKEQAAQIGKAGREAFRHPSFLLSYSGLYTDGELIVRGIEETAGDAAVVFGGMAGDDLTMAGPCVYTNDKASDKAIIALVVDGDKITMKGHSTSGWKPVGTERTVTRSTGSVVYTIDEEPALDVVMRYLGVNPGTPNELNEVVARMGPYFPILMQRKDGDPVVRTSMFANAEERSLKFSGNVPQGSRFRFALPPDFDVIDEVIAESGKVKQSQLHEADALVMFSCVARHVTLGPMVSEEIEGLKNLWGSPLIGFFSYGEIGKATNGRIEFHNNTCCLVAMKETSNGTE